MVPIKRMSKTGFIHQPGSLEVVARGIVEGMRSGKHPSPFKGFSVEFAERREYTPGDPLKHIDWKVFGKTETLYTKKYEAETNLHCHAFIDISSSMFFPYEKRWSIERPNKLLFATYLISSIFQVLRKQRDSFGLSLIGEQIAFSSDQKNTLAHQHLLYSKLEELLEDYTIQEHTATKFPECIREIGNRQVHRSIFILCTDLLFDTSQEEELFFATLGEWKARGTDIAVIHLVDSKKEIDLQWDTSHLELIDMESGETVEASIDDIRDAFTKEAHSHLERQRVACISQGAQYVKADIHADLSDVLFAFLQERKQRV